ncbi:Mce-associated membrane protein [Actinopolyspora lacussalsi subsp. righensis]|uniref:Mce-associated membrane protein n=1 Tax=Actinopolyspora righensis TaxID=995060 RepID=A0A1I6Z8N6_9ACTN|nr:hypothetical protein [Actinopolyspora righensis]SFT59070.1 Mce-associated membrane protein [Actinopolyspora righensis]
MSNSRRPTGRGRGGSAVRKPRVAGARNRAATGGDARNPEVTGDVAADSPADSSGDSPVDSSGEVSVDEPTATGAGGAAPVESAPSMTSAGGGAPERSTELPEESGGLPEEEGTNTASETGSVAASVATDDTAERRHESLPGHEGEDLSDGPDSDGPDSGSSDSDGSTPESSDSEGSDSGDTDPDGSDRGSGATAGSGSARSNRKVLTAVLLALTVGFAGLACWFQYSAHTLRHGGAAANRALVDESATSEVKGQVGKAVEKIFSFDYSNMDKTEQAAGNVLVGDSVEQYDKMFRTVREQAPEQKMVLTTTVADSGVTMLRDGRAEVLLFVNQNATRTESGEGGVYPAQLNVIAVKRGDQWKISSMTQL